MTTINATEGVARVHINASQIHDSHTFIYFVESSAFAHVPTADLLAALDATANTDVKHRADAYEDATRAEQERNEYRLKAVALDAERDHWKARAEKAEATVERVRKWAVFNLSDAHHKALLKNIDPPAFTLPTAAGAGIIARHVSDDEYELRLFSDGKWYDTTGGDYWPEDLMNLRLWTDHRLIGAES